MHPSKLQSSAVAYKYGISGPWWYGGGATVQVLLFAQVSAPKFSFTLRNLTTFVGPARGQAQAQCPICAHLAGDRLHPMGTYSSFRLHVLWVSRVYSTRQLSLTCIPQASNEYHRVFHAYPWWFCNGDNFNRHAYPRSVLPYSAWCCHLRRRWWHASDASLRLVG